MSRLLRAAICAAGLAALGGSVQAAPMRLYARSLTPLLNSAGGAPIGAIAPGAPVEVIRQCGAATLVRLRGWVRSGEPSTLVATPERPVTRLTAQTGPAEKGPSSTIEGEPYTAESVEGWVAAAALTGDPQEVWRGAGELYAKVCAACHVVPTPSVYSSFQWSVLMKTQAANAGLDPAQAALLTAYLQTQSGR